MFGDIVAQFESSESPPEGLYPIFITLSFSGTGLSKLIKKVTDTPYSHTSISFDHTMTRMYSFGRGKITHFNLFDAGFATENLKEIKSFGDDIQYSIYVCFVNKETRDLMLNKVREIADRNADKKLKYNFIGLIYNKFGKEFARDDAFFCSEFVETILKAGGQGFDNKASNLVRPYDYTKLKKFKFAMRGQSQKFDSDKLKKKILEMEPKLAQNIAPVDTWVHTL